MINRSLNTQCAVVGLGERLGGGKGPGMHSMHRSRHWTRHQPKGAQVLTRLSVQDHEIERYCTACKGRSCTLSSDKNDAQNCLSEHALEESVWKIKSLRQCGL